MSSDNPLVVQCPTCKIAVVWNSENQFKPFCSERCRLIDLGDWATESHKIPAAPGFNDVEAGFFDASIDAEM